MPNDRDTEDLVIFVEHKCKPLRLTLNRLSLSQIQTRYTDGAAAVIASCADSVLELHRRMQSLYTDYIRSIVQLALKQLERAVEADSTDAEAKNAAHKRTPIGPGSRVEPITMTDFLVVETPVCRILVLDFQNAIGERFVGGFDASALAKFLATFEEALERFKHLATGDDQCHCLRCQIRRELNAANAPLPSAAQFSPRQ